MRVAFIRSNNKLRSSGKDISGKVLVGGVLLNTNSEIKDLFMKVT